MLSEELYDLVSHICDMKAETQTIEIKSAHHGCTSRLYDTLSSFSNQDAGGTILFGIDESQDFQVVGVYDLQDLQKKVTEQCKQMEPPVRAFFTVAEYEDKPVCAAEIPAIDISERPCYYKGAGRLRGSYIRVGDEDLHMTDSELYSFEAFRKHLHDDERRVERVTFDMLDEKLIQKYVNCCKEGRPGFAKLTDNQILELLHITSQGIPTMAATLNFAIYPQGYFPQLAITCIAVPGTQIGDVAEDSARFTDNRRVEGTISEMVKDAVVFCQRNMKTRTIIDPATGLRKDKTEYPINAVREAILNAVIHRDYSIYSETIPVQVIMYNNRMEVRSPGGLYGRMTVEQLGYAKMDLRNPTLAVMAEKITEAENRNSGIPTMRRECAAYGLPEPEFENRRDEFVVTFYNSNGSQGEVSGRGCVRNGKVGSDIVRSDIVRSGEVRSGEVRSGEVREDNLMAFCENPRSRKEIADYLGLETVSYAMETRIRPLLDSGEILMTIPDKPKSSKQRYYTRGRKK